jgi:hypothetical protein
MFSRRRNRTSSSGYGQSVTGKIGSRRLDTRPTYTPDTKLDSYMSNFRSSRTLTSASRSSLLSNNSSTSTSTSTGTTQSSLFRRSGSREKSSRSSSSSYDRARAMNSLTNRIGSMAMSGGNSRSTTPITSTTTIDTTISSSSQKSKLCCDKCDGKHETDRCPHYRKKRGNHPDERKGKGKGLGDGSGGNFFTRNGRVVRQPGDGSCLFHSLAYGLRGASAGQLRRSIAEFIGKNGKLMIADSPLSDWVKWESNSSVSSYARRMSRGGWGGAIEMAACSRLKGINVHVYERSRGGFKRISCFNVKGAKKIVHVLYGGRVHYDALVL